MSLPPKKISKQAAIHQLWQRAHLSWKLDKNQKELYDLFHNGKEKTNTWLIARRSGKSRSLLILALEVCLSKPNSIVKYVAPTKLQVKTIIEPLLNSILEDCPEELKPVFNSKEYCYTFANKSKIELAGADNGHAEKLRGADSHLVVVDEAGSIDDLDYIVNSILSPTTLITKGKIILASTPPRHADHEFNKFIEKAENNNTLVKKTIYDNPRLSQEDIEQQIEDSGGINSESFRREFLCENIKDVSTAVIPEFDDKLEKEIVKEWPKPPYYDSYVAMDLGFKDLTVVVFGYYDFRAAKIILEDELVVDFQEQDMTLPSLIDLILQKEAQLWMNVMSGEVKAPYLRVSDINYLVTQEITRASNKKLSFTSARKDDNDSAINNMRVMLSSKKVIISPKCKTVIKHLKNVKWQSNKNKTVFARSPDMGHYDGVEALKYLIRHVNLNKNPYPSTYDYNQKDLYVANPDNLNRNNYHQVFKKIFKPTPVWKPNGRK